MKFKTHWIITLILAIFIFLSLGCSNRTSEIEQASFSEALGEVDQIEIADTPSASQDAFVTSEAELEQLYSSFLGTPCSAPCWFDIEPGSTTADQVPTILDNLQEMGIIQAVALKEEQEVPTYHLTSVGNFYIALYIDINLQVVQSIDFYLSSPLTLINFGNIVDVYGEPNMITRGREGENFKNVALVYLEHDFYLEAESSLDAEMISPDLSIAFIRYSSPFVLPHEKWLDWEGYRPFDYYYSNLVVNESIGASNGQ